MRIFYLAVFCLFACGMQAQVTGKVISTENSALSGVTVYWADTSIAVDTDAGGGFTINRVEGTDLLVASFVGFESDTIQVNESLEVTFRLQESSTLEEVVVVEKGDDFVISNIATIKSENISEGELKKAACCDLAGCFETQLTVKPQTTNVLTNAKELRINGLSGVYNQVLFNGFPMIQGLTYTYGISSVPGTAVQNIFVAKGANSVLQGYESISGQINVITKDPADTDKLLLNAYINSFGEKQANVNYAFKVGKWSNLLVAHTTQPAQKTDRDQDTFLDLPQIKRYMISDTWKLGNASKWGWSSEIGFRLMHEERTGGQVGFDAENDKGSSTVYGQTVNINQPELHAKATYRFNDNHAYTAYVSAFQQEQNSYFGTVKYDATQRNAFARVQYEWDYSENAELKTGASLRVFDLEEDVAFTENSLERTYAGNYRRQEFIPGVFAENKQLFLEGRATWMLGARLDHHNDFGWQFTPRSMIKYDFDERTSLRANIGLGWRTVNLFAENINLLVSSRDILFAEELLPERALNYGANIVRKFGSDAITGFFTADIYRTEFSNQIFPDYDTDAGLAIISNFKGTSVSNAVQAEIFFKFREVFEFKTGYTFLDVYRMDDEEKVLLPFNSRHRMMAMFGYADEEKPWRFDVNVHRNGKQRLPDTSGNPEEFQRPDFSRPYYILNGQVGFNYKRFEFYGGCENILDFRQSRPIIAWQQPFSRFFDTSSVWGSTRGREFYLGVRYRIEG